MSALRDALAAVLGVGIGLLCVAYPQVVIRAQSLGRVPRDRGGSYGAESTVPERWLWFVRVLGVLTIVAGAYFGVTAYGAL